MTEISQSTDTNVEKTRKSDEPPGLEKNRLLARVKELNPLYAVISALVIVIIVLLSVVIFRSTPTPEKSPDPSPKSRQFGPSLTQKINNSDMEKSVCKSPECITLAHQLHNWHDPTIDPCVDFYKFACGNFMAHTSHRGSAPQEQEAIMQNLLTDFFRKNETSNFKSENNLRLLYQKCEALKDQMNFDAERQQILIEAYANIQKIGAWPLLNPNWNSTGWDMNDYLVNMAKLRMEKIGFFSLEPGKKIMFVKEIDLRSPGKVENATLEILRANGFPNIPRNQIVTAIGEVLQFLGALNDIPGFEPFMSPLSRLKTSVPSIDFDRILQNLMDPPGRVDLRVLETKIEVEGFNLFFGTTENLETVLNRTQPHIIANYLIFTYIFSVIPFTDFNRVKERKCHKIVIEKLPQAALRLFVRNHFDKGNIALVSDMVDYIKESHKEVIRKSTWLSENSKKRAILKLEMMTNIVGYPQDVGWEELVETMHEKLTLNRSETMLKTFERLNGFQQQNFIDVAMADSVFAPSVAIAETNAFYIPAANHLTMTIPYIDEPHFDATYPKYAKFGLTGQVLSHEIAHAFDATGIGYDENGAFTRPWAPADVAEYSRRTNCLRNLYDNYNDPEYGRNLNGTQVLFELIADQVGLEALWYTYNRTDMSREPAIFGFETTSLDQLFFRIAALDLCSPPSYHRSLADILQDDVHPRLTFRVNGAFSNLKAFGEAFKCPVGSPMNPADKCQIF